MTAHPYDDIEAFALGALDEVTARRLLEHADQCPTCAVLVAEAMNASGLLESSGERPLTRQTPTTSISGFVRGTQRGRLSAVVRWTFGIAATAAIIGLVLWNINLRSSTFTVPVASLVHSHFAHHALHGGVGNAKVIQALDGRWLYLVADGLEPRATYRLWESISGSEREVGTFRTNGAGQATGYWEQNPAALSGFAVTPPDTGTKSAGALRWP